MARGDVVYVHLPLISGSHVQGGTRPAIQVMANEKLKGDSMMIIVPLTKNLDAKRFPFTFQIDPSAQNGLSVPSIALVYQLCAADRTHIGSTLGHLEEKYIDQLDERIRNMLDV